MLKVNTEFPIRNNIKENEYIYIYTFKKDGGKTVIDVKCYEDNTEGKIKFSVYPLDRKLPF
ncbi:MAG: hypothetical protein GX362_06470 [Methanosarcinaceae archaeon]|nr:hypothetical protein [Methanosarcinaceae archaeon]